MIERNSNILIIYIEMFIVLHDRLKSDSLLHIIRIIIPIPIDIIVIICTDPSMYFIVHKQLIFSLKTHHPKQNLK